MFPFEISGNTLKVKPINGQDRMSMFMEMELTRVVREITGEDVRPTFEGGMRGFNFDDPNSYYYVGASYYLPEYLGGEKRERAKSAKEIIQERLEKLTKELSSAFGEQEGTKLR